MNTFSQFLKPKVFIFRKSEHARNFCGKSYIENFERYKKIKRLMC